MRVQRTRPVAAPRHKILGLDLSLVSTGVAYRHQGQEVVERVQTGKMRGALRLYFIRNAIRRIVRDNGITKAVVEGYALGGKGKVFNIGELGGVVLLQLWEMGIEVRVVPPSNLKKASTGKGNADKPAMLSHAQRLFDVTITQDDEIDGFFLLMFGEALEWGTGPAEFVNRVKQNESATEVRPGKVELAVQSIARERSVKVES